jgi:tubulin epsilon
MCVSKVREAVRKATELADSLQCFFLLHSLGGGTGSGLGTYLLGQLAEDYPAVLRFTASVFPSEDDGASLSSLRSLPDSLFLALVRALSFRSKSVFLVARPA